MPGPQRPHCSVLIYAHNAARPHSAAVFNISVLSRSHKLECSDACEHRSCLPLVAGRARLRQQLAQRQQALGLCGASRRQRRERRRSVRRRGVRVERRARRRRGRGRGARVARGRGAARRGLCRRRVHGRVARARAAAARAALAGAGRRGGGRALAPEHKAVHLHHLVRCARAERAAQDPAVHFRAAVSSVEAAAPLVTRLITSTGGGACAGPRQSCRAAAALPDAGALA